MKIGVVVYSKTGHTYEAAAKLVEKLKVAGHEAVLERILTENEMENPKRMKLEYAPETTSYDVLVFGAPVWAFSLCPVMKAYFSQTSSLQGKKTLAFVTMGFPFAFCGGHRAVRQMTKLIEKKGGRVIDGAVISWVGEKKIIRMEQMMTNFSRTIQA